MSLQRSYAVGDLRKRVDSLVVNIRYPLSFQDITETLDVTSFIFGLGSKDYINLSAFNTHSPDFFTRCANDKLIEIVSEFVTTDLIKYIILEYMYLQKTPSEDGVFTLEDSEDGMYYICTKYTPFYTWVTMKKAVEHLQFILSVIGIQMDESCLQIESCYSN
jgi:hypothetical protein